MTSLRIGQGLDSHRFSENRKLIIGGVEIPSSLGLIGHSDADVLIHALVDAILGGLAEGDIGTLFPDTSSEFKNIDSKILLKKTLDLMKDKGYELVNTDSTIIAEKPKFNPHILKIRESLSNLLSLSLEQISVKATTAEKMGALGREEGIFVSSIVLLNKI